MLKKERRQLFKINLSQALEIVRRGEITDGGTCILILKAAALHEKKAAAPQETAANLRTGGVS